MPNIDTNATINAVLLTDRVSDPAAPASGKTFLYSKAGLPYVEDPNGVSLLARDALVPLLAGRVGGQSLSGGTAANDDLTLQGTTHSTRTSSYLLLQPSGGNVGIGVATPAEMLDVNGVIVSSSSVGALKVFDRTNGSAHAWGLYSDGNVARIYSWGKPGDVMAFEETGYVGIGTTDPTHPLDVNGAIKSRGDLLIFEGGSGLGDDLDDPTAAVYNRAGVGLTLRSVNTAVITGVTPIPSLMVNSSGAVGIGTFDPGSKLELFIPSDLRPEGTAAKVPMLRMQGGQSANIWGQRWSLDVAGYNNTNDSRFIISTGNNSGETYSETDIVTITPYGVGIGTTEPVATLDVDGGIAFYDRLYSRLYGDYLNLGYTQWQAYVGLNVYAITDGTFKQATTGYSGRGVGILLGDDIQFFHNATGGGVGNTVTPVLDMHIDHDGNIGMGTDTPSQKLHVIGRVLVGGAASILQNDTSGAIPSLALQQLDVSEPIVQIDCTAGSGNGIDTAAVAVYGGRIKALINNATCYIPFYTS